MSPGVYEWIEGCFGGMSIITIIKRMCAWILKSELSILGDPPPKNLTDFQATRVPMWVMGNLESTLVK